MTLAQAQLAARLCTLRALVLLQRELGSLDKVRQIPRITVYTLSGEHFTQQSEVSDGASGLPAGPRAMNGRSGPPAGPADRTAVSPVAHLLGCGRAKAMHQQQERHGV